MSVSSRAGDAHVNPKDPRLHRRTVLHEPSNIVSSPALEKNKSAVLRDETIPETTVQHGNGSTPPGPTTTDRETAMMTMISNAIDGRLLSRNRENAERSLKKVRAAHERVQRTHSQYPLVVHQSAQSLKKAEETFQAAQQEMEAHLAADKTRLEDFLRIFVDGPAKRSTEHQAQRAELNELRQELKAMQTQISSGSKKSELMSAELAKVTTDLTRSSSENDELKKRASHQETTIETLTLQLKELQQSYDGLIKTFKDNSDTMRREMEDAFKKSTQLQGKAMRSDLGAVEDRVSRLEKNVASQSDSQSCDAVAVQDLRTELSRLQESCKTRDRVVNTTKNEVESLKKSTDVQSERIQNLFGRITDQQLEIQALRTDVDQFKSEVLNSLNDHRVSSLTSIAKKIDDSIEQQNIELELIKAYNDRQAKELERIEKDLTTSVQKGLKEAEESLKASHDNAMALDRIDNELKSKATAFEKEVRDIRKSPHPVPQASSANDSSTAGLAPRIQQLETLTKKQQEDISVVSHNFRWLDHRFNNLETSKLHRAILKSLDPLLPKFEQGLRAVAKLEEEMQQTQATINGIVTKLEGNLEQLHSDFETRSRETKEKQDNMRDLLTEAQGAQIRSLIETSKNNEQISALTKQLDDIRRIVQRTENVIQSSPDTDGMGLSIKGSHERATAQYTRSKNAYGGQRESHPHFRPDREYEGRDSPDELNDDSSERTHSVLLEQFQATATKSIQSPVLRSPLPSPMRGRGARHGKRKHSETESPSRNDRRS
ncbi:hypothetical protein PV08_09557 [Exophiala spinifera]|uniref:Uncharacterized protein n=1 Tax=Exophiala spinifera TaxID=91928 RepID=A0A0D2B0P6_9EURO|nr:uncharacterized protein PV08_09557 [Exophiala spinifera]KIW12280.1 hypothetical protein PV08_09557 [Exophiala spinifera]